MFFLGFFPVSADDDDVGYSSFRETSSTSRHLAKQKRHRLTHSHGGRKISSSSRKISSRSKMNHPGATNSSKARRRLSHHMSANDLVSRRSNDKNVAVPWVSVRSVCLTGTQHNALISMSRCLDVSLNVSMFWCLDVSISQSLDISMYQCLSRCFDVSVSLSMSLSVSLSLYLSMLSLYLPLSPQATRRNTLVGVHGSGVSTSVGGSVSSKKKWGGRHTRELSPERTRRSR